MYVKIFCLVIVNVTKYILQKCQIWQICGYQGCFFQALSIPKLHHGPCWSSLRHSLRPLSRLGRGTPLPTPFPLDTFGVSISAPTRLSGPQHKFLATPMFDTIQINRRAWWCRCSVAFLHFMYVSCFTCIIEIPRQPKSAECIQGLDFWPVDLSAYGLGLVCDANLSRILPKRITFLRSMIRCRSFPRRDLRLSDVFIPFVQRSSTECSDSIRYE